jgi:hypothetical protein
MNSATALMTSHNTEGASNGRTASTNVNGFDYRGVPETPLPPTPLIQLLPIGSPQTPIDRGLQETPLLYQQLGARCRKQDFAAPLSCSPTHDVAGDEALPYVFFKRF